MFFSTAIMVCAFIPLFTMHGAEGELFGPMAQTYAFALGGALLMALTLTPVLCLLFFRNFKPVGESSGHLGFEQPPERFDCLAIVAAEPAEKRRTVGRQRLSDLRQICLPRGFLHGHIKLHATLGIALSLLDQIDDLLGAFFPGRVPDRLAVHRRGFRQP